MPDFSIGVDLGGTNLRIAAVSADGELLEKVTLGTKVALGRDHVIAVLLPNLFVSLSAYVFFDFLEDVAHGAAFLFCRPHAPSNRRIRAESLAHPDLVQG